MNATLIDGLDGIDQRIVADRSAALAEVDGIRVGDFIDFADGETERVAHIWTDLDGPDLIQPSHGSGSFHLTRLGASFSGGLYPGVPADKFTDTGATRLGAVWIFHHDLWGADRGVDTAVPFRVFTCSTARDGGPVTQHG